jgi:lysophospholipase L1-like esterase
MLAGCAKGVRRTLGEGGAARTQGQGAEPTRKSEPVIYVALGDSTGVGVGARRGGGYVARLFERLERERPDSRVVNLCASGAETGDVLRGQVPRVAAERPTLVTLGVGINDLTHGVEVERFAHNFEEIVSRIKVATDAPVVVTNIPDISTAPRVPAFMREGVSQRIALFNGEIGKVAARRALWLVDAYGMSRKVIPAHPEFFSPDGFHPSDEGYEYWAKMIWTVVKESAGE